MRRMRRRLCAGVARPVARADAGVKRCRSAAAAREAEKSVDGRCSQASARGSQNRCREADVSSLLRSVPRLRDLSLPPIGACRVIEKDIRSECALFSRAWLEWEKGADPMSDSHYLGFTPSFLEACTDLKLVDLLQDLLRERPEDHRDLACPLGGTGETAEKGAGRAAGRSHSRRARLVPAPSPVTPFLTVDERRRAGTSKRSPILLTNQRPDIAAGCQ